MSASALRSRPVISQSIHTRGSEVVICLLTGGSLSPGAAGAARGDARPFPAGATGGPARRGGSAPSAAAQADEAHQQARRAQDHEQGQVPQPLPDGVGPQRVLAVGDDLVHVERRGGQRVAPAGWHEPGYRYNVSKKEVRL